jgi:hypothetical protein
MRLTSVVRCAMLPMLFLAASAAAVAQIRVAVNLAPPELPIYEQPLCPGDGYIWTPGYWAWADDYYWVPGTWVMPPEIGFLWTPPYWGWGGDGFLFYDGYWGTSIGFYGGINYGYGYWGHGYDGGRWDHGHFYYNTTMNNVNGRDFHNVYSERVNESGGSRVSFSGGKGGIDARPSAEEQAAGRERHIAPVAAQTQHMESARNDPQQRFSANHGEPPSAGNSRPGNSREGASTSVANASRHSEDSARDSAAVHPNDLSPLARPAAPNTGDQKLDAKYQKQQDKMVAKQNQQRQKLQQTQDKEHQQMVRQNANQARTQQMEQRHQQQTQQMQQRHVQQAQQMEQRQSSSEGSRAGGGERGGGGRH